MDTHNILWNSRERGFVQSNWDDCSIWNTWDKTLALKCRPNFFQVIFIEEANNKSRLIAKDIDEISSPWILCPPEGRLNHPGANECNVFSFVADFWIYKSSGSLHTEVTLSQSGALPRIESTISLGIQIIDISSLIQAFAILQMCLAMDGFPTSTSRRISQAIQNCNH